MIRVNEFRKIDMEVQNAIQEAFEFGKLNEKVKNDFYLFLSNAAFIENNVGTNVSQYVIDNLKSYYSLSQFNTSDSKESLTMEMMMYTHIWESKIFLK